MRKPVVIILFIFWSCLIFYMSSYNGISSHIQSTKIAKFVSGINIAKTTIKDLKVTDTDNFIRKNAHAFEYIVLSILISLLLFTFNKKGKATIIYILFICLLIAVLDEFYQSFIPGRSSSVRDVLIDFAGSLLGMGIFNISYFLFFSRVNNKL
jgi:VanZ family protein